MTAAIFSDTEFVLDYLALAISLAVCKIIGLCSRLTRFSSPSYFSVCSDEEKFAASCVFRS